MFKKIIAYLGAHRILRIIILCLSCAIVGFVGGIIANRGGFSFGGFGSIDQGAASVIRGNQSAIDANQAAQDILRRARDRNKP